jgi:hypothetical protein
MVIIGRVVAINYYIYVVKPHLTWMDKKLTFLWEFQEPTPLFSIAMDFKCRLGLFKWRLGVKSSMHVRNGLFICATYNNNIEPIDTTTKEGYIAIQISSQTTKKKVSENP